LSHKIIHPIENKILLRMYGRGRGWAFTKVDFVADLQDHPQNTTGADKVTSLTEETSIPDCRLVVGY
jgi:hypothetical protein